jgi:hypothetical protein
MAPRRRVRTSVGIDSSRRIAVVNVFAKAPTSSFSLHKASDSNCQLVFNHFKFGPGELRTPCPERQILSMRPTRCDDLARFEGQQVGDPEFPDWNQDIDFDRNSH